MIMDLTSRVGFELDSLRTQIDRMAQAHRNKKEAAEFVPAWYAARAHLSELARILSKQDEQAAK